MPFKAKESIKRMQQLGWRVKSQKGSHVKMEKNGKITCVPNHSGKDIKMGTLKAIEKQTGEKLR